MGRGVDATAVSSPVAARKVTSLTLRRVTPGPITAGAEVKFRGTAPKRLKGERVKLQRKVRSGRSWGNWVKVKANRVRKNGRIWIKGVASSPGKHKWRLVIKARGDKHVSKPIKHKVYGWYHLSGLEKVESVRFDEGAANIGGVHYSRSVFNRDGFWWDYQPYGEWNLSYRCIEFRAAIGLGDTSSSDGRVAFRATVDGADTNLGTKQIGPATPVSLDVRHRLRIRLTDVYVAGPESGDEDDLLGVWGNARVLCAGRP